MTVLESPAPARAAGPPVPWRPAEAIWTTALNIVGAVVVFVGWLGVSGTARLSHQYGWTSVAVVGLVIAALGNGLWLLGGRRAVGVRRRRLLADPPRGAVDVTSAAVATSPPADDRLVTAPAMTRYHRPGCILVRGKDVRPYEPARRGAPAARPCGMCRP